MNKLGIENTDWLWRLKGLAILGIVLYHWFNGLGTPIVALVSRIGGQGVHIFIILSAFGLTLSASKGVACWQEWYKKRIIKLLYPYYVSILIVLAIALFCGILQGNLLGPAKSLGISAGSLSATLFLYRGFIERYVLAINSPWWFVITILEFYLIFPVLFRLWGKYKGKFLAAALCVNLVYQFCYSILLKSDSAVFQKLFPAFIFEFSLGIALAGIYINKRAAFEAAVIGVKPLIFGVIMEAIGTALALYGGARGMAFNDIFNAVGIFLILMNIDLLLSRNNIFKATFERLGRYSMAIFLTHAPLIPLFFAGYKRYGLKGAILALPVYLVMVGLLAVGFNRVALGKARVSKCYKRLSTD